GCLASRLTGAGYPLGAGGGSPSHPSALAPCPSALDLRLGRSLALPGVNGWREEGGAVGIWGTLERAGGAYPQKLAVIDGETRLTYAEVRARAAALARFFHSRGVDAGDRISILHSNSHEFLEAYYAAAGLAAILNPLNVRLAAREIAAILRDAGA